MRRKVKGDGSKGSPPCLEKVWTPAEDAVLRAKYGHIAAKVIAKEIGRGTRAVMQRANKLGIVSYRRWSPKQDANLRAMWGDDSLKSIARALKRTMIRVYVRAQTLGLPLGCPDGYEYLGNAAKRTGFSIKTLRKILRKAGVQIKESYSRPTHRKTAYRYHIVDSFETDEAVTLYLQGAPLNQYTLEYGCSLETLQRSLRLAKAHTDIQIPEQPTTKKGTWRVSASVVAAVMAWKASLESVTQASLRLRMDRETLKERLAETGAKPIKLGDARYFTRETVDAAASRSVMSKQSRQA